MCERVSLAHCVLCRALTLTDSVVLPGFRNVVIERDSVPGTDHAYFPFSFLGTKPIEREGPFCLGAQVRKACDRERITESLQEEKEGQGGWVLEMRLAHKGDLKMAAHSAPPSS